MNIFNIFKKKDVVINTNNPYNNITNSVTI